MPLLCRSCLHLSAPEANDAPVQRCPACASVRLVRHPELTSLTIGHVDCDAFYAAVEKRDHPELKDKPLIIGGGRRGVVSTCCYIARLSGVKSAMPMFKALQLCPQAVVMKPDMARYVAESQRIRALMEQLTPAVEPLSIDEAFLDLAGTARVHGAAPAVMLARLARDVEAQIGITLSVGLSYNKFLAKLASDMNKPSGFTVIGRAEAVSTLAPLPVRAIWGVGPATARRLASAGLTRIGQLAEVNPARLRALVGADHDRLRNLAQGIDTRQVQPDRARKSVSTETTLESDLVLLADLSAVLQRCADRVARTLREKNLSGQSVTLKMKTSNFRTLTRTARLKRPTQTGAELLAASRPLLGPLADGTAYRLIGLGVQVGSLHEQPDDPPSALADLFDPARSADIADAPVQLQNGRAAALEQAVDAVRRRFGDRSVQRANTLKTGKAPPPTPDKPRS